MKFAQSIPASIGAAAILVGAPMTTNDGNGSSRRSD